MIWSFVLLSTAAAAICSAKLFANGIIRREVRILGMIILHSLVVLGAIRRQQILHLKLDLWPPAALHQSHCGRLARWTNLSHSNAFGQS
jgi:hypothetical protein